MANGSSFRKNAARVVAAAGEKINQGLSKLSKKIYSEEDELNKQKPDNDKVLNKTQVPEQKETVKKEAPNVQQPISTEVVTAEQQKQTSVEPAAEAEVLTRAQILEKQGKERKAEERERVIQDIMEKTGWTYRHTSSQLKAARKIAGVTAADYRNYKLYEVPGDKLKEKYNEIVDEKNRATSEKFAVKRERYISEVVKATGWDPKYAKQKMIEAKEISGASFEHYTVYKFWELTPEEQKTYFCKADAEKLRVKYNKNRDILRVFMHKDLFCKNFDEFLGRPWLSTQDMTLDEFKKRFASESKIMYKPLSSSGGHGIEVFELSSDTMEETFNTISALPKGILEGYLIQHPEMKKLSLKSVNTIRVVTIMTEDDVPNVEKNKVNLVYAGVRMGQGDSYVDNLHSGGMIAAVDMETGIVSTNAVDFANKEHEYHPDTGIKIKGFQIPYFQEMKAMIEKAGAGIPGYLGWDIAIAETGPVVVELNSHPEAGCLQTPYIFDRKGKRHVIERFLGETDGQ